MLGGRKLLSSCPGFWSLDEMRGLLNLFHYSYRRMCVDLGHCGDTDFVSPKIYTGVKRKNCQELENTNRPCNGPDNTDAGGHALLKTHTHFQNPPTLTESFSESPLCLRSAGLLEVTESAYWKIDVHDVVIVDSSNLYSYSVIG
ncbi:Proliferating cell nuclear antigen [Trichinella pseudospiralis]